METGTLVHVDPSTLLIDTNVRTQVRLDAKFKASIKTHGVLQPIVAISTDEGLHVRFGQRRTLAQQPRQHRMRQPPRPAFGQFQCRGDYGMRRRAEQ